MCEKAFLNVFFCVSYDTGFEGVYIYSNLIIAEKNYITLVMYFSAVLATFIHVYPHRTQKIAFFLNITKTTCSYLLGIYMFDI